MRRFTITLVVIFFGIGNAQALSVSEIMSNPVGDDAGREWVEVYNESDVAIDITTLAISIKGGNFVSVVPVEGGVSVPPKGYAIVSSIVSASSPVSRFLDSGTGYPNYAGILARVASSVSFVNTGTTSIDLRLNGSVVDSLSYTPAGEGKTLSRVEGVFVSGAPTPGLENQASVSQTSANETSNNQTVLTQISPPSPDIVLYLPSEKLVVAGAETEFSVYGMTRAGQIIDGLSATWSFGDGGHAMGTTTGYAYAYPGRYLVRVDAGNAYVRGVGTVQAVVVSPEVIIKRYGFGKYGAYVDIENPNSYDLDLSQWRLWIGFGNYVFPKNTVIAGHSVTRISGRAMGFEKTIFREGDVIKLTFPNLEEITRLPIGKNEIQEATSTVVAMEQKKINTPMVPVAKKVTSIQLVATTSFAIAQKPTRDTRLVSWFKSMFTR